MEQQASRLQTGAMKVLTHGKRLGTVRWLQPKCISDGAPTAAPRQTQHFPFVVLTVVAVVAFLPHGPPLLLLLKGFVCLGAGAQRGDFLRRAGNLERHQCLLHGLTGSFRFIDSPHCSGCAKRKSKLGGGGLHI